MYLIQLLSPLRDNRKTPFSRFDFDTVRRDLAERFERVTAFLQSPGEGLSKQDDDDVSRDDVVIFEGDDRKIGRILVGPLSRGFAKKVSTGGAVN